MKLFVQTSMASGGLHTVQSHLSKRELRASRKDLHLFMRQHPLATTEVNRNWVDIFLSLWNMRLMAGFMALVVFVTAGGTVAYAAEEALPGDFLYPVKLKVNEQLAEQFSFSAEAKVRWSARQVERRLDEAEKVLLRLQANPQLEEEIEMRIQKQTDRLEQRLSAMDSNDENVQLVRTRTEKRLEHHEEFLQHLQQDDEIPPARIEHLLEMTRVRRERFQHKKEAVQDFIEQEMEQQEKKRDEQSSHKEVLREQVQELQQDVEERISEKKVEVEGRIDALKEQQEERVQDLQDRQSSSQRNSLLLRDRIESKVRETIQSGSGVNVRTKSEVQFQIESSSQVETRILR